MQVRRLDTTRRKDRRQFIRFPFDLYQDYPQWVPPLIPDMRLALNRGRYPFYRTSEADFYVAEKDGQTLGRIAVLENRPYNDFHKTRTAFFYYFEAVDDAQVARALFDAAFAWARKRGMDHIVGPNGLLRGDGHGLLVEGFEHRPAVGIAYNPPYYERLVLDAGFSQSHDYFSGYLDRSYVLPQRFRRVAERVKAKRGYWVRSFTSKRELLELVPAFHKVYQEAFVQVWGYYPVTEAEIETLVRRIASIADPRLIKVVMKGQEPIGFAIAYPDVSAALQRVRGRLWPFGWIHLMVEAKRTRWINFNGVGILPEYQGAGANVMLYNEISETFQNNKFRFQHGDFVQVADSNIESLGEAAALGISWYKRHRVYQRPL